MKAQKWGIDSVIFIVFFELMEKLNYPQEQAQIEVV